jgi:hypothetical protein
MGIGGGQSECQGDVVGSFSNLGLTTSVPHARRGCNRGCRGSIPGHCIWDFWLTK